MNQINTILASAGINPNVLHTVMFKGKKREVTPLGHLSTTMVARLDMALCTGNDGIDYIIDNTEDQPQVFLRRQNAPKRQSSLGTKSLLKSLNVHANWLCGSESHGRAWKMQFVDTFGMEHLKTANAIQAAVKVWYNDVWSPEKKRIMKALDTACLAVSKQVIELAPPPAEINLPPEVLEATEVKPEALETPGEVVRKVCAGTKKDGSPCTAKANSNGYCTAHRSQAV